MKSRVIVDYEKQIANAEKNKAVPAVKNLIYEMYISEPEYRNKINKLCAMASEYKNSLTPKQMSAKKDFLKKLDDYMAPLNNINGLPRLDEINPNNYSESFYSLSEYATNRIYWKYESNCTKSK